MQPTVLLVGGGGQVGFELRRELAPLGRVVAPRSAELDLGAPEQIQRLVQELRPSVIVNAAAYTAVDRAESEPEAAHAINAVAPGLLAHAAATAGASLVHFSTDYVFDGAAERPYTELDEPAPLGVYGRSKLEGERRVAQAGGSYLILRTGWVFSRRRHNFMLTMLRLARTQEEMAVVADQRGAPTSARLLAAAAAQLIAHAVGDAHQRAAFERSSGVLHLSAAGETTWHGFAEAILAADPERERQVCRRVRAIATADYPTPARRPAYSVLDNTRVAERFGIFLPSWQEHLAMTLED